MEVNTTFEQIEQLITNKNFTDSGFSSNLQHLASEGNRIFVVVDKLGNNHIAEVYYDSESKGFQPPLAQQRLHLLNLPLPILLEVAVGMKLFDVLNMCKTNTYLNQVICESNDFWKSKFIHDFGVEGLELGEERIMRGPGYWKEKYKNSRLFKGLPYEKIESTEPVVDKDYDTLESDYWYGGCAALSWYYNTTYGWPIYLVYVRDLEDPSEDGIDHTVVKVGDDLYLDVDGYNSERDIDYKLSKEKQLTRDAAEVKLILPQDLPSHVTLDLECPKLDPKQLKHDAERILTMYPGKTGRLKQIREDDEAILARIRRR